MKKRRMACLFMTLFILVFWTVPISFSKKPDSNKPNILLITIDTLRADRLGCYGSPVKTPNIDQLARQGTVFTRVFASAPTTLPSHTTLLLGTTPLHHGVHDNFNFIVDRKFLTLAEHLKDYGYATAAFVSSFTLDSRFGLDQGFDVYDDDFQTLSTHRQAYGERRAEAVVDRALGWLETQRSPWFLWVHCFDPHEPYDPPEPYKTQYAKHPYDGEVAYVDAALGKLLGFLETKQLFSSTVVIVTADHGESLGEHGELTHGFFAYNSTLWVPLILSLPEGASAKVADHVSHIDVFPTVCEALDIKKPSSLEGISLLRAVEGKSLPKRKIYIESLFPYYNRGWAPLKGYIDGRVKFIDSPIPEIFDIAQDFHELNNLTDKKAVKKHRKRLMKIIGKKSSLKRTQGLEKIDQDALEMLNSLGYMASPQGSQKESFGPQDDVKVLLPFYNQAKRAARLYEQGRKAEAVELLNPIINQGKNVDVAYTELADIHKKENRLEEAVEVLELGTDRLPWSYFLLTTYVHALLEAERYDDVIEILNQKRLPQMEYDAEIWNSLGFAYWKRGHTQHALSAFKKGLTIDSEYANIYANRGAVYHAVFLQSKDEKAFQWALQNYTKAVELDPEHAEAHRSLGRAYRESGDLQKAIIHWEKAISLIPDPGQTLYDLSLAYLAKGDIAKGLDHLNLYKKRYSHRLSSAEKSALDRLIQKWVE